MIWSLVTASAATFDTIPTLEALDRLSRGVVAGHVVGLTTTDAPWGLVTTYEIAVDRVLDGAAEDVVHIQLPGGRKGELVQTYGGVPAWAPGDDVLVFLPRGGGLPLSGVFTVREGGVVHDPLARLPEPVTVDEVADRLSALAAPGH